jgi:hypothetical protein
MVEIWNDNATGLDTHLCTTNKLDKVNRIEEKRKKSLRANKLNDRRGFADAGVERTFEGDSLAAAVGSPRQRTRDQGILYTSGLQDSLMETGRLGLAEPAVKPPV